MMGKSKKTRIPKFRSYEEEAKFWDRHDATKFLKELKPAKLTFPKPRKKLVSIRLPESEILVLKKVAARKGIGYQTLIRIYVTEQLLEEIEGTKKAA